jgi:regulator of cell morphogenesis and NO signaling
MPISPDALVAEIATASPATIAVFQRHHIDFCCGGRIPLSAACRDRGIETETVLQQLEAAVSPAADRTDWSAVNLSELITHIQQRYHEPLRDELPRLEAMLVRVLSRHGDQHGETLRPLHQVFDALQDELLAHMSNEDAVLFPAIRTLEADPDVDVATGAWLDQPIRVMQVEHEQAASALARIRLLTDDYTAPAGACPTFRGLYFGLWQLEVDMHVHIHLENNILFPRAAVLCPTPQASGDSSMNT